MVSRHCKLPRLEAPTFDRKLKKAFQLENILPELKIRPEDALEEIYANVFEVIHRSISLNLDNHV